MFHIVCLIIQRSEHEALLSLASFSGVYGPSPQHFNKQASKFFFIFLFLFHFFHLICWSWKLHVNEVLQLIFWQRVWSGTLKSITKRFILNMLLLQLLEMFKCCISGNIPNKVKKKGHNTLLTDIWHKCYITAWLNIQHIPGRCKHS